LYVPCVSVMGAIARETNKSWMTFSIFWGLNVAYSLAALFYQTATFNEHPQSSLITISAVIIFNIVLITVLRRVRSRVTFNIKSKTAQQCSGCSNNSCH
ncbi:ferrous iron transport protein B, partial [Providencia alcalifaciens]